MTPASLRDWDPVPQRRPLPPFSPAFIPEPQIRSAVVIIAA